MTKVDREIVERLRPEYDLTALCFAERGIVAVCGAGGKKTLIEALARCHPGPVGVVCTTRMPSPGVADWRLLAGSSQFVLGRLDGLDPGSPVVMSGLYKPGVLGGLPTEVVPEIQRRGGFRVVYLKADGARGRLVKAPRSGEPVMPPSVDTVLYVVSAHAFEQPITDDIVHRPERFAELVGLAPGERIGTEAMVRLLTHPSGALQGVGKARLVIVINRVDTPERERMGRDIARRILAEESRIDRVLLMCAAGTPAVITSYER